MSDRMTAADFNAMTSASNQPKNKYKAKRTFFDGHWFDSKHEAKCWGNYLNLQRAGEITDLERQVPIMLEGRDGPLMSRKGRQMRLTVDFRHRDVASGQLVWSDAKGKPTPDYEVRRAVAAAMGIEVIEI